MKNKLALLVAVVLGLIAVWGVHKYIQDTRKDFEEKHETVYVVAAGERIKAGEVIKPARLYRTNAGDKEKMIAGLETASTNVTADHISTRYESQLVGQTINRTVERGEPLLWSYFRQPVEKLEARLEPDHRALTLGVDAISGVAGNLTPGSRVDIIGTFPLAPASGTGAAGARSTTASGAAANQTLLVLANVRILALDTRTRDEEYTVVGGTRVKSYSSVTVSVTSEEANVLVFAQQFGTLTLVLRPAADVSMPATPDVGDKNFLPEVLKIRDEREKRLKSAPLIESVPMPRP